MQRRAYIMSYMGPHLCTGCHFPVSREMDGLLLACDDVDDDEVIENGLCCRRVDGARVRGRCG